MIQVVLFLLIKAVNVYNRFNILVEVYVFLLIMVTLYYSWILPSILSTRLL